MKTHNGAVAGYLNTVTYIGRAEFPQLFRAVIAGVERIVRHGRILFLTTTVASPFATNGR